MEEAQKKRKRKSAASTIAQKSMNRKDGFGAYEPLPHQADFHKSGAKYRAMVSGVGGGKTSMGVRESIKFSQMYPGSLGLIGRLNATSLRDTTMRRFFEICPQELIYDWKQTTGHLLLYTPVPGIYSEILFRRLDEPGPLGSLDLDWWWIDEAHEPDGDEVPVETFRMLSARLRGIVGPLRGWVTSNSGGKDWIWQYFFSPAKGEEYWGRTVKSSENPYLPPGYVEGLMRNNPKEWVDRFLDASFDVFEGQIFTEFIEKINGRHAETVDECYLCHVYNEKSPEIRTHLKKLKNKAAGFDFGVSAPTAVPFALIDQAPDGTTDLWITDEFYRSEANISLVAAWIKMMGLSFVYADPSTQNRGPTGESPMMLYAKEGVSLIPAVNDVTTKISTTHQFLLRFRIHISSKCVWVITQLQSYRWKPQPKGVSADHREAPLKRDDHAFDALAYLLVSIGVGASTYDAEYRPNAEKKDKGWRHPSLDEDEDNLKNDNNYITLQEFLRLGGM